MSTITIDTDIYKDAEIYAKHHNVSVKDLVEKYFKSLISARRNVTETSTDVDMNRYKISPRIKALETNFLCPSDITDDYKAELKEQRSSKYL